MLKIQQITNDAKQKHTITLTDGTSFQMQMAFIEQQNGWFIVDLTYGDFNLKNFRIFNSPDMLYQYRNKIPFGIACVSKADREPMFQNDFSTENSVLYVLTEAEVTQFAGYLSGQVQS